MSDKNIDRGIWFIIGSWFGALGFSLGMTTEPHGTLIILAVLFGPGVIMWLITSIKKPPADVAPSSAESAE